MRITSPVIGRVRPQSQDYAKPIQVAGVSGDAFGADVGKAAAGIGAVGAAFGNQLMDRDTQFERFDALQKQSDFEARVADRTTEVVRTARPDGTDVPGRVLTEIDKEAEAYLNAINPNLREEMKVRVQNVRNNAEQRANQFKNTAQDAYVQQSVLDELSRAKTVTNQDPDQADAAFERLREMINSSQLPPIVKQQQLRMVEVELRKVEGQRRIASGQYNDLNADPAPVIDYTVEKIIQAESSGNPNARANPNNSSATGLAGFTSDTWLETMRRHMPELAAGKIDAELLAMRYDPKLSQQLARALTEDNAKVFRSNGIAATPTNLYLAHFLGVNGAVRALAADPAASVQTFIGAKSLEANKAVFEKVKTQADLVRWASEKMGTAQTAPQTPLELKQDKNGFWVGEGIEYDLSGKVRSLPVSREYVERVVPAVRTIDPGLSIKITSAGQEAGGEKHPFTGKRIGSHRHDVDAKGESGTSDFVLLKNGKPILPEENKELYAKVMEELAARGFTGIGHYKWGIHVGGGSRAAWGPSTTSQDLDPVFKRAIERGWARASDRKVDAFDTDLRYASIPFEDRVLMRQAAQKEVQGLMQQEAQQRQAAQATFVNNLMNGIMDGKIGQKELDGAYQSGMLSDYKQRKAAQDLLDRVNSDTNLAVKGLTKLGAPGAIWDPTSSEDRNMLNAMVRSQKGLERIAVGDKDYFTNGVLPMVQKASDIPTELVGTLLGMVRSNNLQTSLFAVDALSQLQRVDPRAFEQRVPAELQRDVEFFNSRRGTKGDAELMAEINGGTTPEEMMVKETLRKQAKDMLSDKVGGKLVEDKLRSGIIDKFDGWFSRAPTPSSLRWAEEGMLTEARAIFVDEYVREKDVNKAIEATTKLMAINWGISDVNEKKVLMKHPPEKVGYKPLGGDFKWITESVRSELKLAPEEKFELLSDRQTENEVERFRRSSTAAPPSYMVVVTDKNGKAGLRMKNLPDGREVPFRMNFKPTPEMMSYLIDREDNAHKLSVQEQEVRELRGFVLMEDYNNLDPSARRELRQQLEVKEAELNRLRGIKLNDPRREKERQEEERLRKLGEQSTFPSMRN